MNFSFPITPARFTTAEQTIIEYIAGHRDEFFCMTIVQLSRTLNISEATISRFARHVGCEDFKQLKQIIMEQTLKKGPAVKLKKTLQTGTDNLLSEWLVQQQYYIQKTSELLDQNEFKGAVEAIYNAKRVFIFAKNASRSPAGLLEFRLRRIGIDVCLISPGASELLENLALMNGDDLVTMFGFSKISSQGNIILDYGKTAGYKTLLFTSRLYHNESTTADIELFVYRGEEDEYHSMTAPVAVIDALILSLSARLGDTALSRLEKIQSLKKQYGKHLGS